MPIYEYVCSECGHTLEALQKFSDAPLLTCPECNNDGLKKKISAPGFRLSGSGWYETDFKDRNQKNLSKGDSADAGKAGKADKSDSKPDKKDGASAKAAGKDKEAAA